MCYAFILLNSVEDYQTADARLVQKQTKMVMILNTSCGRY